MTIARTIRFSAALSIAALAFVGTEALAQGPSAETTLSKPTVKLMDPGKQPHSALRYNPKTGEAQSIKVERTGKAEMSMGPGQQMQMDMPTIQVEYRITPESVDGENIAFNYGYDNIDLKDTSGAGINPMVQQLEGMLGPYEKRYAGGVVDSRGMMVESPNIGSKAEMQQLSQALGNFSDLSVVFPEEPIGVGGKWEVVQEIKEGPMTLKLRTEMELVSSDNGQHKISHKTEVSNESDTLSMPELGGAEAKFEKFEGKGSGWISIDPTRLLASEFDTTIDMNFTISMNQGGQSISMSQHSVQRAYTVSEFK